MRQAGNIAVLFLAFLGGNLSPAYPGGGGGPGGFVSSPVATRELLLPYIVFLSPLPQEAKLLSPGVRKFTLSVSDSSSFAGDKAFRSLMSPIPGQRLEVNRALIDQFRLTHPGTDLFFIDGEVLWSDFIVRIGLLDRLEIGIEVPIIHFSGGFGDRPIEEFHDSFGFPNDGRSNLEKNRFNVALFLGQSDLFLDGVPTRLGLGDITLSAKTPLYENPETGVAFSGALYLKLPTGSENNFMGSGNIDTGFQIFFSRQMERQAIHLSTGAAHLGDWDLVPEIDPTYTFFASGTYEGLLTRRMSILAQLGVTASPFRDATTNDLAKPSYRINAGLRWRLASGLFFEGIIEENLIRTNSNADFGLHFAVSRLF